MRYMEDNKQKIFVSYTGKDQDWAIWIAAELENILRRSSFSVGISGREIILS